MSLTKSNELYAERDLGKLKANIETGDYLEANRELDALGLNKNSYTYLFFHSLICHKLGQFAQATHSYRKARNSSFGFPVALYQNYIAFCIEKKQYSSAIYAAERVVHSQVPTNKHIQRMLGIAYSRSGRHEQALKILAMLYRDHQLDVDVITSYTSSLNEAKKHRDALSILKQRKDVLGMSYRYLMAAGNTLKGLGRLNTALSFFRSAERYKPENIEPTFNVAVCLQEMRKLDKSYEIYSRVLTKSSNHIAARWNRAEILLLKKNFLDGFKEYEIRWLHDPALGKRRKLMLRIAPEPQDLDQITGKKVLVYYEQGYGDTIMFSRFLRKFENLDVLVYFQPQQALLKLYACSPLSIKTVQRQLNNSVDFSLPLGSLPKFLGIRSVDDCSVGSEDLLIGLKSEYKEFLSAQVSQNIERIGIAWTGNPKHGRDHERSINVLDVCKEIFTLRNIEFYSLHPVSPSDRELMPNLHNVHINTNQTSFLETALLINQLDLVITVDTAVAHLAGALGKKTVVLLPPYPDWRWGIDNSDSYWYKSLYLLRRTGRSWLPALREIRETLEHAIRFDDYKN